MYAKIPLLQSILIQEQRGYFHILAIVNNASVNMKVIYIRESMFSIFYPNNVILKKVDRLNTKINN